MLRASYYALITMFVLTLSLVSCSSNDDEMPPNNTILIRDNFYEPAQLSITLGRSVVWRNQGTTSHTATSGTPVSNPGALFDSGTISPGSGFTFTFTQPGTYVYFCRINTKQDVIDPVPQVGKCYRPFSS